MRSYFFESPSSFEELLEILDGNTNEVKPLAGGSDFVPRLSKELDQLPNSEQNDLLIMSLADMGLDFILENETEVRIGAMTTLTQILENSIIQREFPVLIKTVKEIAGVSVRNIATMGGNIMNASPAADSVPTLMALDAVFVLSGSDGIKRIDASDFFEGPGKTVAKSGEILTEIILKKATGNASFKKLGRRKAETLSVVNAAAYIERDNNICMTARIAIGSVAPTVLRCKEVEDALVGKELTEELIKHASDKVLDSIKPIDDIRASAWYRSKVAPVMIRRAIEEAIAND